jgi:hypothetical protein
MRFTIKWLLGAQAGVGLTLFIIWVCPKSERMSFCPTGEYIGFYRGFGLVDYPPRCMLGKSYYRIRFSPPDVPGAYCDFFLDGSRLCRFLGRYPSGTVREEGTCEVEWTTQCIPMPNANRTHFGRYYQPNGTLASEIRDGTGVQTYWNDEGVKLWELELDSLRRIRVTMWDMNGDRIHEETPCR